MHRVPSIALLLLAILAGCRASGGPRPTAVRDLDLRELDAQVRTAMSTMQVPGLALAVVDAEGVVMARGYGVRAIGSDEPVDADTLFEIGSITKTFTATAVALLVDRGELEWTTAIRAHVPEFALDDEWVAREFTLADALSHRGGYLDNYFYDLHPTLDRAELLARLRHSTREHAFRTAFEYNNAFYALAADVLEASTGRYWSEFVTTEILAPLGMHATRIGNDGLDALPNHAAPHVLRTAGLVRLPSVGENAPLPSTGAIVSSANDMAKWCSYQLHLAEAGVEPALRAETVHAMRTVHASGNFDWFPAWGYGRARAGYGLGWQLLDYRDDADQHVLHGGATLGMQAWMVVSPKHGYAIVMMSNAGWAGDRMHFAIANWIHDRCLGLEPLDWTGEMLRAHRADYDRWLVEREPSRVKDLAVPTRLPLADYAGTYDHPMYGPMIVTLDGAALEVHMGVARATAEPWGGEVFRVDWDGEDPPTGFIAFEIGDDGTVRGLVYDDGWTFDFTRR